MNCLLVSTPSQNGYAYLGQLINTKLFYEENVINYVIGRIQNIQPNIFILDESLFLYVESNRFVVNISEIKKIMSYLPHDCVNIYLGTTFHPTEDGSDKLKIVQSLGFSHAYYDSFNAFKLAVLINSYSN